MVEIQFFIPLADNDGHPFTAEHIDQFESFATALFGGLTRYSSQVTGLWVDQGTTFKDHNVVYGVALKSISEGGKVAQLAEFAKAHFRQLAIFVKYLGVAEIL